jgi:hypothetical protein
VDSGIASLMPPSVAAAKQVKVAAPVEVEEEAKGGGQEEDEGEEQEEQKEPPAKEPTVEEPHEEQPQEEKEDPTATRQVRSKRKAKPAPASKESSDDPCQSNSHASSSNTQEPLSALTFFLPFLLLSCR